MNDYLTTAAEAVRGPALMLAGFLALVLGLAMFTIWMRRHITRRPG